MPQIIFSLDQSSNCVPQILTSLMRCHARDAPVLAFSTTLCSSFTSFALSYVLCAAPFTYANSKGK